jgi:hypothetical protein
MDKRVALATFAAIALASATLASRAARAQAYRAPEYGWNYGEIEGPRTLAMSGAARAFGGSTSSIPSNPANTTTQRVYHFEGLFSFDTRARRLQYGAAVLDSVTSRLALGVLASKTDLGGGDDPAKRSGLDVRAATGFLLGDRVSFGATAHYLRTTQDGVGPLGESPISRSSSDDANFRALTFDAGLAVSLGEAIRLGAVGYNLTDPGSPVAPLMVGGGLGVKLGDLVVEGNVVGVDRRTWGAWKTRVQLGLEYLVADHYPLRIGYLFDQGARRHAVSGGLGYVDRSFAIDLGVRGEVAAPDDPWGRALVFALGLRYFYDSAAPDPGPQF